MQGHGRKSAFCPDRVAQTLQALTLLAPPSSAILYSSSNSGTCDASPTGTLTPRGTEREEAEAGEPQLGGCSGSTSLPAGHDHAVIGALAMNSAEKGESASENSQLSSHCSTEESTTFVR